MAVGGKVNFVVDDGTFIGQRKNCDMCNTREHDGYCSKCELYICQICFDNHIKSKSCRDHVLLQDSHESNRHETAIRFETCAEHNQQEVKAYCTEHKCCICIECILLHHKSCAWEYIIDASNRFQNSGDLARLLEKVQGLEYTLDKCMETIDKHTKSAEAINKDVISNIESFTKSLVKYVVGSKQQVLDGAKVQESAHQHKLDKLKVDIQSLGSQVEEIITDFRDEDKIHKRFILAVETMPKVARIQDEPAAIDCNNVVIGYTFQPRNILKRMMSNKQSIGRLTDASQLEEDVEDDEDIKLTKERERSKGLEQQFEENQIHEIFTTQRRCLDCKQNKPNKETGTDTSCDVHAIFENRKIDDKMCGVCGYSFERKVRNIVYAKESVLNTGNAKKTWAQALKTTIECGYLSANTTNGDIVSAHSTEMLLQKVKNDHLEDSEHIKKYQDFNKFKEKYIKEIEPNHRMVRQFLDNPDYKLSDDNFVRKHYRQESIHIERLKSVCLKLQTELNLHMIRPKWNEMQAFLIDATMSQLMKTFNSIESYIKDVHRRWKQKQDRKSNTKPTHGDVGDDDQLDDEAEEVIERVVKGINPVKRPRHRHRRRQCFGKWR